MEALLFRHMITLWRTAMLRLTKLKVTDEVNNAIEFHANTFVVVVPRLYASLEQRLARMATAATAAAALPAAAFAAPPSPATVAAPAAPAAAASEGAAPPLPPQLPAPLTACARGFLTPALASFTHGC